LSKQKEELCRSLLFLGDPDFVKIPLKALMDDTYLKQRMSSFNVDKATLSSDIKEGEVNYR
jgi:gamma-glutamyltranspeptidase/glutathione hydrolase